VRPQDDDQVLGDVDRQEKTSLDRDDDTEEHTELTSGFLTSIHAHFLSHLRLIRKTFFYWTRVYSALDRANTRDHVGWPCVHRTPTSPHHQLAVGCRQETTLDPPEERRTTDLGLAQDLLQRETFCPHAQHGSS